MGLRGPSPIWSDLTSEERGDCKAVLDLARASGVRAIPSVLHPLNCMTSDKQPFSQVWRAEQTKFCTVKSLPFTSEPNRDGPRRDGSTSSNRVPSRALKNRRPHSRATHGLGCRARSLPVSCWDCCCCGTRDAARDPRGAAVVVGSGGRCCHRRSFRRPWFAGSADFAGHHTAGPLYR